MEEMVDSQFQRKFGTDKRDNLPAYCQECEVRFVCNGGCPKNRFIQAPTGEDGLNYLCAGYKMFFNHVDEPMRLMAAALEAGRPANSISPVMREEGNRHLTGTVVRSETAEKVGRNSPCPCGSGKKHKHCCLRK